jgi:competence transcription factor ComK
MDRDTATKMKKWVDHIGVDFLNKSTSELEISLQEIKSFNYKTASVDYLMKEKKRVKEQLKKYDIMFEDQFHK